MKCFPFERISFYLYYAMTKVGGIFTRYLTPALKILLVMGQSLGRKMEKFRLIVVISRPNHRKILFQSLKKVIFNSYHE